MSALANEPCIATLHARPPGAKRALRPDKCIALLDRGVILARTRIAPKRSVAADEFRAFTGGFLVQPFASASILGEAMLGDMAFLELMRLPGDD